MKEKDIVREAMSIAKFTQVDLQTALQLNSQSSVSAYLKSDSMRVDTFVKMLNAMGYEVVVKGHNTEWKVEPSIATKPKHESNKPIQNVSKTTPNVDLDTLLSDEPTETSPRRIKLKQANT